MNDEYLEDPQSLRKAAHSSDFAGEAMSALASALSNPGTYARCAATTVGKHNAMTGEAAMSSLQSGAQIT